MATKVDLGKVVGPQGPQGATGPQGPVGPQGPEPTDVVKLTGNQTIDGDKTFIGNVKAGGSAFILASGYNANRIPIKGKAFVAKELQSFSDLMFNDEDGKRVCVLRTILGTDGNNILTINMVDSEDIMEPVVWLVKNGDKTNLRSPIFAAAGMPSNSIIDYSGEDWNSGHVFTAPYSGWLVLCKKSSNGNQYLQALKANGLTQHAVSSDGNQDVCISVPMAKGDTTTVYNNLTGNWTVIRFVKALAEV